MISLRHPEDLTAIARNSYSGYSGLWIYSDMTERLDSCGERGMFGDLAQSLRGYRGPYQSRDRSPSRLWGKRRRLWRKCRSGSRRTAVTADRRGRQCHRSISQKRRLENRPSVYPSNSLVRRHSLSVPGRGRRWDPSWFQCRRLFLVNIGSNAFSPKVLIAETKPFFNSTQEGQNAP